MFVINQHVSLTVFGFDLFDVDPSPNVILSS